MIDIVKKTYEEVPPQLEEIVFGFEQLSLTPATSPPLLALEWLIETN